MAESSNQTAEEVEPSVSPCCSDAPQLEQRVLLSPILAGQMSGLFKVLSNDTRLRLLHELIRTRESSVGELASALGMSLQAVSNQLARLTDWGILNNRRDGNTIFYRITNPCVYDLLDRALCIIDSNGWCKPYTERTK